MLTSSNEAKVQVAHDLLTEARPVVYVVWGRTGEYSDRNEWNVSAHLLKTEAEWHLARLENWCREKMVHGEQVVRGEMLDYDLRRDLECPFDPYFSCDYTGTDYGIAEVPFGGVP